ncbi:MAG TPA: hypothetical protein VF677_03645, partial [Flavobacterium sp.]
FSTYQTLIINDVKKDSTQREIALPAGKIIVWANNRRKKKKVVFVQVKVSATSTVKDASPEKDRINEYLRQALIELDDASDIITLEVSDSTNSFNSFINGSAIKRSNGFQILHDYLKSKLQSRYSNLYDSHFKAFYFSESGDAGLSGYSAFGADFVVVFGGSNNQTASHEFLHSLNLPHTFDNSGEFTYEYKRTENLLDYSHHIPSQKNGRYALWYWQWKKANNSI